MDEYYCNAYPDNAAATDFVSENPLCPNDQYFNVEVEYTDMYVLNERKFHTDYETTYHSFQNVSKDKMMQEATIVAWLSHMGVPKDAHKFVVANILNCAHDMANRTHMHTKVLSMRVVMTITRASEDGSSEDDEDDDDDFVEEEEEGDGVAHESMEEDEDDNGLVPAAKSSIEELEMVRDEQEGSVQGKCAICFEDFLFGVRMPCLHMFHRNCIADWLQIGSCCPLCRFQMPTRKGE